MGIADQMPLDSYLSRYRDRIDETFSDSKLLALLTTGPAALLFTFLFVFPVIWSFAASMHSVHAFAPGWEWVGFSNYTANLFDPDFWVLMYRSLLFAGGSVIIQLVVGIGIALLLNRELKYRKIINALVFLPYLVPTAILGLFAVWMTNSSWGIVNQIPVMLGLADQLPSVWGDGTLAMAGAILVNSWKFTIFVTIMVLARLQGIPDNFYDAARAAGATKYQVFRDITLPNLTGIIAIVLLLRGVWMFNKFDIIWVLTRGGPADATTTAPVYAYIVSFEQLNLGDGAAISVILFIMLAGVAVLYFKILEPSEEVDTA